VICRLPVECSIASTRELVTRSERAAATIHVTCRDARERAVVYPAAKSAAWYSDHVAELKMGPNIMVVSL